MTFDVNDNMTLTSISAYRNNRIENGSDADYTAADLIYIPGDGSNNTEFSQLSQELRLAGEWNDKLNWLVGIFAAKEDLDNQAVLNYGTDFYSFFDRGVLASPAPGLGYPELVLGSPPGTIHAPGIARIDQHSQEDRSFAIFTNNDYKVTDRLTGTLGLRYTQDKKELNSRYTSFSESCTSGRNRRLLAGIPQLAPVIGGLCFRS